MNIRYQRFSVQVFDTDLFFSGGHSGSPTSSWGSNGAAAAAAAAAAASLQINHDHLSRPTPMYGVDLSTHSPGLSSNVWNKHLPVCSCRRGCHADTISNQFVGNSKCIRMPAICSFLYACSSFGGVIAENKSPLLQFIDRIQ